MAINHQEGPEIVAGMERYDLSDQHPSEKPRETILARIDRKLPTPAKIAIVAVAAVVAYAASGGFSPS